MKTILFTGARSGIASSIIEKLVIHDYFIYITVHTLAQLKEVKENQRRYL